MCLCTQTSAVAEKNDGFETDKGKRGPRFWIMGARHMKYTFSKLFCIRHVSAAWQYEFNLSGS